MSDFQRIDTKKFLNRAKTASKTSETPKPDSNGKKSTHITERTNQQNQLNPKEVGLAGFAGLPSDEQDEPLHVPDVQNGLAGFAGSFEVHKKQKSVAVTPRPDTIPRLPFDLERLISAASNERLELNLAGVHDPNRYVMGWACAYLTGDRQHALQMLRQAQQARVTN